MDGSASDFGPDPERIRLRVPSVLRRSDPNPVKKSDRIRNTAHKKAKIPLKALYLRKKELTRNPIEKFDHFMIE
jgi:hypothetical protein